MKRLFTTVALFGAMAAMPLAAQNQSPASVAQEQQRRPAVSPEERAAAQVAAVKGHLDRILLFLGENSPAGIVDSKTGEKVTDYRKIDENSVLARGRFGIVTYEWGVTYSGMLKVAQVTGDSRYTDYVYERFKLIGESYPYFEKVHRKAGKSGLRALIQPKWLDDCGSMEAAMVKGVLANPSMRELMMPPIASSFDFVMNKEYRLEDRALARLRPTVNSVWVDDMYMGIPPIAYMGKLMESENPELARKYYDEALLQIELFKKRLWIPEKRLFRHGWIESMSYHPNMFWGRANGWATLTMCDVLDILPADHPKRQMVMDLLVEHLQGVMALQGGDGFWHQLLDRNDSYRETSATAIFTYCLAHAVNEGWVDAQSYAPAARAGWRAVTSKINEKGEVEGTCVGTGLGFEPGFYYQRPTNVDAPHGYGPVFLAGSEMIRMMSQPMRLY